MQLWEQNPQWREADLYFDFSKAIRAIRFDDEDQKTFAQPMKAVDFVVEWEKQFWLIEVKDPECGAIPAQHRAKRQDKFRQELLSGQLIEKHLFPKLRDTLIYLGLDAGIPAKPLRYLSLIGLETLEVAEMEGLRNKLWQYAWVAGPKRGWHKPFDVHALNVSQWNRLLTQCPITRISHQSGDSNEQEGVA